MTKVLIIGFRHSGTTMLMQLIRAHPQVGWIEDEESFIEFNKPKEWVVMMASKKVPDFKNYVWGEKIPWGTRKEDKNGQRAINMSKKWLKYFGKKGRVIQIVRHPLDVFLSGRGGNEIIKKQVDWITNTVEKVSKFMNQKKQYKLICYEDLVTYPEIILPEIFSFLNIRNDKKVIEKIISTPLKFGKINAERAFAFKKKGVDFEFDYKSYLENLK
jgi:hypothetical protein